MEIQTVFSDGIFYEIAQYLSLSETMKLAKEMPWITVDIERLKPLWIRQAIERIREKLLQIGWTPGTIASLKTTSCYIAGSFPLQCLMGEFWKDSDIDIFTQEPQETRHHGFIEELYGLIRTEKNGTFLRFNGFSNDYKEYCVKCQENDHCEHIKDPDLTNLQFWENYILYLRDEGFDDCYILTKILYWMDRLSEKDSRRIIDLFIKYFQSYTEELKKLKDYRNNYPYRFSRMIENKGYNFSDKFKLVNFLFQDKYKVQLILYHKLNPIEGISKFDFDFCKVYFDGETLHVDNWDSILYRKSKVDEHTSERRIKKYKDRGFMIEGR